MRELLNEQRNVANYLHRLAYLKTITLVLKSSATSLTNLSADANDSYYLGLIERSRKEGKGAVKNAELFNKNSYRIALNHFLEAHHDLCMEYASRREWGNE